MADNLVDRRDELLDRFPALVQPRWMNPFQFAMYLDEFIHRDRLSARYFSKYSLAKDQYERNTLDFSNVDAAISLAWLSFLAYADERDIRAECALFGFRRVHFWRGLGTSQDSTQLFIAEDSQVVIVSVRGEIPLQPGETYLGSNYDLERRYKVDGSTYGRLRACFVREMTRVINVFAPLRDLLYNLNGRQLYFTGHGVGGALATVLAATMLFETRNDADGGDCANLLVGLYTFGSPKVGDEEFASNFNQVFRGRSFRVVNRHEFATHFPPLLGAPFAPRYAHIGAPVYFDGQHMHPDEYPPQAMAVSSLLLLDHLPTEIIRRLHTLKDAGASVGALDGATWTWTTESDTLSSVPVLPDFAAPPNWLLSLTGSGRRLCEWLESTGRSPTKMHSEREYVEEEAPVTMFDKLAGVSPRRSPLRSPSPSRATSLATPYRGRVAVSPRRISPELNRSAELNRSTDLNRSYEFNRSGELHTSAYLSPSRVVVPSLASPVRVSSSALQAGSSRVSPRRSVSPQRPAASPLRARSPIHVSPRRISPMRTVTSPTFAPYSSPLRSPVRTSAYSSPVRSPAAAESEVSRVSYSSPLRSPARSPQSAAALATLAAAQARAAARSATSKSSELHLLAE